VSQPLLAPNYYLVKALSPFADMREARAGAADPIRALLEEHVAIMILADIGAVSGPAHEVSSCASSRMAAFSALRRLASRRRVGRSRPGPAAPRRAGARRVDVLGYA